LSSGSSQSGRTSLSIIRSARRSRSTGSKLPGNVWAVVKYVSGKAAIFFHPAFLFVLRRVKNALSGVDGYFDVKLEVDVRLGGGGSHFQAGRVVDAAAAAAGLSLGRADVELGFVSRKVRAILIIGLLKINIVIRI